MSMVRQEKAVFIVPIDSLVDASGHLPGLTEKRHQIEVEVELLHVIQVRDRIGRGITTNLIPFVADFGFALYCALSFS